MLENQPFTSKSITRRRKARKEASCSLSSPCDLCVFACNPKGYNLESRPHFSSIPILSVLRKVNLWVGGIMGPVRLRRPGKDWVKMRHKHIAKNNTTVTQYPNTSNLLLSGMDSVFQHSNFPIFHVFLFILIFPFLNTTAQSAFDPNLPPPPPYSSFIEYKANRIGQAEALRPVFKKLKAIEQGKKQQLRIVHLGDSHVQADLFSGELRALLQRQFGAAGRGLAFPYRVAGTHGPFDLKAETDVSWSSRRRIFQKEAPPIGVSGMGLKTTEPVWNLFFHQKDRYGIDYAVNKVSVFHSPKDAFDYILEYTPDNTQSHPPMHPEWVVYEVQRGDNLSQLASRFQCTVDELKSWNQLRGSLIRSGRALRIKQQERTYSWKGFRQSLSLLPAQEPFLSSALLETPVRTFNLKGMRREGRGSNTLFGLLLENTLAAGIQYSMAGVNGATFYHFNHAEYFLQQLPALHPDLIIITLGTNESLQRSFRPKEIEREVNGLLKTLRERLPQAAILLTVNPDVLVRKSHTTPNTNQVREILLASAKNYQAAYWDFYTIMGGTESIRDWQSAGLAAPDFIHFTEKGYILKAQLVYAALMSAYHAVD